MKALAALLRVLGELDAILAFRAGESVRGGWHRWMPWLGRLTKLER